MLSNWLKKLGLVLSQIPLRRERPKNRERPAAQRTTTTRRPANSDDDESATDQCPEPDGYFADADQCDKYYACSDG